ncbi:MAG: hypothetical protein AAB672_01760 [Patescibacteria group bacterium]
MTIEQPQINDIYIREYERAKARLLDIFKNKDEQEMEEVYSEIKKFSEVVNWSSETIIKQIKNGFNQENPEIFVNIAFNALRELIDKKIEHPEVFEKIRRERIMQHQGNIKLSELMYYNVDLENGVTILHVANKGDLRLGEIIKSFRDGMKELAKQVKEDERIKEIQAASWIVASNPGLLEKAGFIIKGPIDEKMRAEYFSDEERLVSWANMSRKTLLEKYLNT